MRVDPLGAFLEGEGRLIELLFCLSCAKTLVVGTATLFPPYFLSGFSSPSPMGEGWGEGLPLGGVFGG